MTTAQTRTKLTPERIRKATCEPGKQQTLLRDTEVPSLALRITQAGAKAFVIESKLSGKTLRMTIGDLDTWTLEAARKEARRLKGLIDQGIDPRAVKAEQATIDAQRREAERLAIEAEREAGNRTLEKLLLAYCDLLEARDRQAHRDARSIFKAHVIKAWPKLARSPAAAITGENLADMLRKVREAGKARTANKLRAYVSAAFHTAQAAAGDPSVPVAFKAFGITTNPATATRSDPSANKADKNPLSEAEMTAYWRLIEQAPGLPGAVLRLHLLTGGQRVAQLVRITADDLTEGAVVLRDSKGRPGPAPRKHVVPLTRSAAEALFAAKTEGHYVLSTDGGKTAISPATVSAWAKAIVGEAIPGFQIKRIRSGVETLLSRRGVSREIRGHLQSHGIGGIQTRHYDDNDHLPEKRRALELLYAALNERVATVTAIRSDHVA